MQRSSSIPTLRIHIRTFVDKLFGNFLVTVSSRLMQRSHSRPQFYTRHAAVFADEVDDFACTAKI